MAKHIKFLTGHEAQQIDVKLMSSLGFSIDQLMELAGLSVASAICKLYPPSKFHSPLILCGPGNNGGDGLVAARHLHHFGYRPRVCYPKPTAKALYQRLLVQCRSLSIPIYEEGAEELKWTEHDVVVDAIFGFSFDANREIRAPFGDLIKGMVSAQQAGIPVVSVDVPSSWDVEKGDIKELGLQPDCLISLTAPKLCAQFFKGPYHVLGGRFVPPAIANEYQLHLPAFPGADQFVVLPEGLAPPPKASI